MRYYLTEQIGSSLVVVGDLRGAAWERGAADPYQLSNLLAGTPTPATKALREQLLTRLKVLCVPPHVPRPKVPRATACSARARTATS